MTEVDFPNHQGGGDANGSPIVAQLKAPSWMEIFVGTILAPTVTFAVLVSDSERDVKLLPGGLFVTVLSFAFAGFCLTPESSTGAPLNVLGSIIGGLCLWLLTILVVGVTALCFGRNLGTLRALAVTLGWSMLPLVFLGPLSAFRQGWFVFFTVLLLAWVYLLQVLAIKQSCHLKVWQVLLLIFVVPSLVVWLQLWQFLQYVDLTLSAFWA